MADLPGRCEAENEAVAENEALLQFLYLCPHGMAQFSGDGTIVMLNPAFARMTMPLLPPGAMLSNVLDIMEPWLPELRSLLGDPRPRGMLCDGTRVHLGPSSPGRDPGVLSLTVVRMDADRHMLVLSDVTRQVADERRLRESEAWFTAVAQGASDYAVLGLDADGRVSGWNIAAERMFGHKAEAIVGRHAGLMIGAQTADARLFNERLRQAGRDGWHLDDGWRTRADGSRFWGTCMVSPMERDEEAPGAPHRYLMVVRDVTEQRHSAHELRRALTADHLTGVLNRRCFLERAEREVARRSPRGPACCLAMVDVDHFKSVNDTFGHACGDAVLCAIADVLRHGVRDGDLVGRLGGEEFAVLMPATDPEVANALAERLRAGVAALRLTYDGRALQVTVSIGVSFDGRVDLKRLLLEADDALFDAKKRGRNRVCQAGGLLPVAIAAAIG